MLSLVKVFVCSVVLLGIVSGQQTTEAPENFYYVKNATTDEYCIMLDATIVFNIEYVTRGGETLVRKVPLPTPQGAQEADYGVCWDHCTEGIRQIMEINFCKNWTARFTYRLDIDDKYYNRQTYLSFDMVDDKGEGFRECEFPEISDEYETTALINTTSENKRLFESVKDQSYQCITETDELYLVDILGSERLQSFTYSELRSQAFVEIAPDEAAFLPYVECRQDIPIDYLVPGLIGGISGAIVIGVVVAYIIMRINRPTGYEGSTDEQ